MMIQKCVCTIIFKLISYFFLYNHIYISLKKSKYFKVIKTVNFLYTLILDFIKRGAQLLIKF